MNKKTKILVGSIAGCALVLGAVATGLGLGLQKQEIKGKFLKQEQHN